MEFKPSLHASERIPLQASSRFTRKIKHFLAAAVALTAAVAAQADDFTFSYTSWPYLVTGSFSGTPTGDLITNLSDISVKIDGSPLAGGATAAPSRTYFGWNGIGLGGVVSISGVANNFIFSVPHDGTWTNTDDFYSIPNFGNRTGLSLSGTTLFESFAPFTPGQWTVTAVPEPETYAMLLAGLGLIGVVSRRRITKPIVEIGLRVS